MPTTLTPNKLKLTTSIKKLIEDIKEDFRTGIDGVRQSIDGFLGNEATDAVGSIEDAASDFSTAVEDLVGVIDRTDKVVAVLEQEMNELPGTAAQVKGLIRRTDSTVQSVQKEVRDLRGVGCRANKTLNDVQTVVDGVKNHWLLRRSIRRSQQKKRSGNGSLRSGNNR